MKLSWIKAHMTGEMEEISLRFLHSTSKKSLNIVWHHSKLKAEKIQEVRLELDCQKSYSEGKFLVHV